MSIEITKTEFQAYSYFWLKFGERPFEVSNLNWFFSKSMVKKILFTLSNAGWLKRISRGLYKCVKPQEAIKNIFEFRAEKTLIEANLPYCFFGASAIDIWSDQVYTQRSWEYSPIFIQVKKRDLKNWKKFFKKQEIDFFLDKVDNALGEFIVLKPVEEINCTQQDNKPVTSLKETMEFAEKNIYTFEYPLAYIARKFKKKAKVSKESLERVGEAL